MLEEAFINLVYYTNIWHFNEGKLTVDMVKSRRTPNQTAGSRSSTFWRLPSGFFLPSEERGIWLVLGSSSSASDLNFLLA